MTDISKVSHVVLLSRSLFLNQKLRPIVDFYLVKIRERILSEKRIRNK